MAYSSYPPRRSPPWATSTDTLPKATDAARSWTWDAAPTRRMPHLRRHSICLSSFTGRRRPKTSNGLRKNATLHHMVFALSAIAIVAFLFSRIPNFPWHEPSLLASSVCTGAFLALSSAFWFEHFIDRPMESIALSLTCCLVGGVALSWFLIGTTTGRFTVGYTLTILLAGISLGRSLNKKGRDGNDNPSILPPQSVVVLLVSIFMLCFAAMLSVSYAGRQSWHTDEIWLIVLPAALIVLFTVLFMRKVEAGVLLNIALAIVAAGLLVSFFSPSRQAPYLSLPATV